jgi:hypothetical protein
MISRKKEVRQSGRVDGKLFHPCRSYFTGHDRATTATFDLLYAARIAESQRGFNDPKVMKSESTK